jgi:hypothetical protein
MEKILLRRLELLLNKDWTKEHTLKNILELVEGYSKRFIIFADSDENVEIEDLDELYAKFADYYDKSTDINGKSVW